MNITKTLSAVVSATEGDKRKGQRSLTAIALEHALSHPTGVAMGVLSLAGLDPRSLREALDTLRLNKAMTTWDLAGRAQVVAHGLGDQYVGIEHLMLATMGNGGVLEPWVVSSGLTGADIHAAVIDFRGGFSSDSYTADGKYSAALNHTTDLVQQARLDGMPAVGLEDVTDQLHRWTKSLTAPGIFLVGPPKSGRTTHVFALAERLMLRDGESKVFQVNAAKLLGADSYSGQASFDAVVKDLCQRHAQGEGVRVLFIDEPRLAARSPGAIQQAISKGWKVIIETTSALRGEIVKVAGFDGFGVVEAKSHDQQGIVGILESHAERLCDHHEVNMDVGALAQAAKLTVRYDDGSPGHGVDILDAACALVSQNSPSRPGARRRQQELKKRLVDLLVKKSEADPFDAVQIGFEVKSLEAQRQHDENVPPRVQAEDINTIVSQRINSPVGDADAAERKGLKGLNEKLLEVVFGQDKAVKAVSDAVVMQRAGLRADNKPTTMIFLGPTGVGKTQTAKALAATLFGSENAMVRIDMSEYKERHSASRLYGAPPGYLGHDAGGQLTNAVKKRPYCVVLLDEIEKAHHEVLDVFLQVFDDGRMTDGKGHLVDFTKTVIIMTSNIGAKQFQSATDDQYNNIVDRSKNMLRQHMRPEFVGRIGQVCIFRRLSAEAIKRIVLSEVETATALMARKGFTLEVSDSALDMLSKRANTNAAGARGIKSRVADKLIVPLSHGIVEGSWDTKFPVKAACEAGQDKLMFTQVK